MSGTTFQWTESAELARPTGPMIVSLLGGVAILAVGIWVGAVAGTAASLVGGSARSLLGTASAAAFVVAFFGFLIVILALGLYARPDLHVGLGISILVLSLLSVFGGAGLFLGLLLGVIGGIWAIVFHTGEEDQPLAAFAVSGRPAAGPARGTGPRCPNCGGVVGPASTQCPYCETPLTPGPTP